MAKRNERLSPHEAEGDLLLTAIHFGGGEEDGQLGSIMALRWTDETGKEGQSNHVRLGRSPVGGFMERAANF